MFDSYILSTKKLEIYGNLYFYLIFYVYSRYGGEKMKVIKYMFVLLISLFILSGCTNLNNQDIKNNTALQKENNAASQEEDNVALQEENNVASQENKSLSKMYVVQESSIFSESFGKGEKLNVLLVGSAIEILKYDNEWCFVEPLNIYRYDGVDTVGGWVEKEKLGYYGDLKSNIGVDVLVKKGYEPEWSQKFDDGLWGIIFEETETDYTLGFYGASIDYISKNDIEPFFKE